MQDLILVNNQFSMDGVFSYSFIYAKINYDTSVCQLLLIVLDEIKQKIEDMFVI